MHHDQFLRWKKISVNEIVVQTRGQNSQDSLKMQKFYCNDSMVWHWEMDKGLEGTPTFSIKENNWK